MRALLNVTAARSVAITTALALGLSACASKNDGLGLGATAKQQKEKRQAEIPHCIKSHGTLAIYEPKNDFWTPLKLPSPEAIIKVFVAKSGCFKLLDRGGGFDVAQQERDLATNGDLQRGSNIGKGQIKAADYVLVPDIVSKNNNASGTAAMALLGGILGAATGMPSLGAVVGGISINSKTADVVLTLTDVRTSEQKEMAEGHGEHTDWGFGGGGLMAGPGVVGGAAVSSYQNTDIGQVLMLAYVDAYAKLVTDLGYLEPSASAAAPKQSLMVVSPGHVFAKPDAKSKALREVTPGMLLYPTGVTSGRWYEVKDEVGTVTGWVAFQIIQLAK